MTQDPARIPSASSRVSPARAILAVLGLAAMGLVWMILQLGEGAGPLVQISAPAASFEFARAVHLAAVSAGLGIAMFSALHWHGRWDARKQKETIVKTVIDSSKDLQIPTVLTDAHGQILWLNAACTPASQNDGAQHAQTDDRIATVPSASFYPTLGGADLQRVPDSLAQVFERFFPNPQSLIRQLSERLNSADRVEECVLGLGRPMTLRAIKLPGHVLWQVIPDHGKAEMDHAVPTLTLGRNRTILFMNDAARAFFGHRIKSLDRILPCAAELREGRHEVITAQGPRWVRLALRDGQIGRQHVFVLPDRDDEPEETLSLTDLPVPLIRLTRDGTVLQVNAPAKALLGEAAEPTVPISELLESLSGDLSSTLENAFATATSEAELMRATQREKETFLQVVFHRLETGQDDAILVHLIDATELKSLEAQFVQSQKMQAIGQLAGGVAHDFNNLLTAISGHCDLMLLRHDHGDQDYADLMQVHQNANRAAALVSQLLAFSRKQTLQPETLDLRETLSDLGHLLNRLVGEKVVLGLSHDPVLKSVRADKRQLEQVIMNLVVNARDAMPEGGQITIETESLSLTSPMRRERAKIPPGEYVVVRVRDEGVGIDPDIKEKMFEPFFTTKKTGEGTGLGLSTAYGIIKQTGGFIFADSEAGQGTCISLLFPAASLDEVPAPKPVEVVPAPKNERLEGVVLLVEDEAPVRAFASRALSMRGFKVLEASSAEEALRILEDSKLEVDVFVSDVVMPGLDGPTWVSQALEQRPDVRVVFMSGYAEGAFDADAPKVPASVFLQKPFSLADLTKAVQDQMRVRLQI